MSAVAPYPWLQAPWYRLQQARLQGRLPHALLISAAAGMGKRAFADGLAQALLCTAPDAAGQACGQCTACQRLAADSHPDLLRVQPEEEGKAIRVDQVRHLSAELTLKSHAGGYKVALLYPAERMNVAAANSLLKTLEEPTDNTVLMLLTAQPAQLAATIRSRCQQIALLPPPRDEALAWLVSQAGISAEQAALLLDLAAGAPLQALATHAEQGLEARQQRWQQWQGLLQGREDPLALAAQWSKESDQTTLVWMQGWISDMIRISSSGDAALLRNADLRPGLAQLAQGHRCATLYQHLDRVTHALRTAGAGLNRQLQFEDILVAWAQGSGA